jgi:hypothetical protein
MQSHKRRLLVLGASGTLGYRPVEGVGRWNSAFMAAITLTTGGYD